MTVDFKPFEEKMQKTLNVLESEYKTVRAGRANPSVLDKVSVEYYGTDTPINQVASISVSEARVLVIQPYDKSLLGGIERAILASEVGINPANDGTAIRLVFPQLTEERRKELCKAIRKQAEDSKVAIRSIRRDAMDMLKAKKKASEITEDDQKHGETKLQKLTDEFVAKIDSMADAKEKEIMSI